MPSKVLYSWVSKMHDLRGAEIIYYVYITYYITLPNFN